MSYKSSTFASVISKPDIGGPASPNSSMRSTKTKGAVGSKTVPGEVTSNISNPLTDEEAQITTGLMAFKKQQEEPVEGEAKPSPQEVEALKKKDLLVADAKKLNDSVKSLKRAHSNTSVLKLASAFLVLDAMETEEFEKDAVAKVLAPVANRVIGGVKSLSRGSRVGSGARATNTATNTATNAATNTATNAATNTATNTAANTASKGWRDTWNNFSKGNTWKTMKGIGGAGLGAFTAVTGIDDLVQGGKDIANGDYLKGIGNLGMGALGFIPGLGWAGRGAVLAAKGLKGVRGFNAASKAIRGANIGINNAFRTAANSKSLMSAPLRGVRNINNFANSGKGVATLVGGSVLGPGLYEEGTNFVKDQIQQGAANATSAKIDEYAMPFLNALTNMGGGGNPGGSIGTGMWGINTGMNNYNTFNNMNSAYGMKSGATTLSPSQVQGAQYSSYTPNSNFAKPRTLPATGLLSNLINLALPLQPAKRQQFNNLNILQDPTLAMRNELIKSMLLNANRGI